jgi:hypothetical protein
MNQSINQQQYESELAILLQTSEMFEQARDAVLGECHL